jgi:hypothetical protein
MPSLNSTDILKQMEVRGSRGLFVLGSAEPRVSVLAQQERALNLVFSLFSTRRLRKKARLAIIGAGAAGLTAAAAGTRLGWEVEVFERRDRILSTLRGSPRFLHPHLYDWPAASWQNPTAGLELMNWTADSADDVVTQLESAWTSEVADARPEPVVQLNCEIRSIRAKGARLAVSREPGSRAGGEFDAVIIAVGFGPEKRLRGAPHTPYWNADDLHQMHGQPEVAIIGSGDGALTDLFRVTIVDFGFQRRADQRLLTCRDMGPVTARLAALETRLADSGNGERDLLNDYRYVATPELDKVLRRRRKAGGVTLVTPHLNGFDPNAFSLNRFLLSRLLNLKMVKIRNERVTRAAAHGDRCKLFSERGTVGTFDRVVTRIGCESALGIFDEQVRTSAQSLIHSIANLDLDQTRRRIWTPGLWTELHVARNHRSHLDSAPEGRATTSSRHALRIELGGSRRIRGRSSSAFSDSVRRAEAFVTSVDPDSLPIDPGLTVSSIAFGEGSQREVVDESRLVRLDPTRLLREAKQRIESDRGERYVLSRLVARDDLVALLANPRVHFPREVTVVVRKSRPGRNTALICVTDILYPQDLDKGRHAQAVLRCRIGRGGLAAFLNARDGSYQNGNPYIVGDWSNGVGSIGVLVAIALERRKPVARSLYTVVLRKGIRFSDDVWIAATRNRALLSPGPGPASERRFMFQSREPRGGSTDIFVADFNGENLVNVTEDNQNAYDGFLLDGRMVARWIDERTIQYSSMIDGVKRVVKRTDPAQR